MEIKCLEISQKPGDEQISIHSNDFQLLDITSAVFKPAIEGLCLENAYSPGFIFLPLNNSKRHYQHFLYVPRNGGNYEHI